MVMVLYKNVVSIIRIIPLYATNVQM